MFAAENEGYLVASEAMDMESVITLKEDGTGSMTMNGDTMGIASWTLDGDAMVIIMDDESSAPAAVHNGILELDILGSGDYILYFAQPKADLSAYHPLSYDELMEAYQQETAPAASLLGTYYSKLASQNGVHMNYDVHYDFMDSDRNVEMHAKDGMYYSLATTKTAGLENRMITLFRDDTAYNLNPDDMTGTVVTSVSVSALNNDPGLLDALYQAVWTYSKEKDFEVREGQSFNGATCTAEFYPAGEYRSEATFYFDGDGNLLGYLAGPPVIEGVADIGESLYTVNVIADAVDESLFDISAYKIS